MLIARKEGNGFKYTGMMKGCDKEEWFKATCEAGTYIAYVDTPWKRNINEFTISSYGPETCDFSPAPIAIPPTMISDCLSDLAETDKNGFTWYREQNQPNIGYKFMHCKDGFGFFYFKNSSADTTLTASVELTTLQGCELLPPYSGRNPEVSVSPYSSKIITYRMIDAAASISFKMRATFRKGDPVAPPSNNNS